MVAENQEKADAMEMDARDDDWRKSLSSPSIFVMVATHFSCISVP